MTSAESVWSFLNEGEASVIEGALRTALVSVLQLFKELHEKRWRCCQLKLDEAERQKAALTFQLKEAEQELEILRQTGCGACKNQMPVRVSPCAALNQQSGSHLDGEGPRAPSCERAELKQEPAYESACRIKDDPMTSEHGRAVDSGSPLLRRQTELARTSWNEHQMDQDPAFERLQRRRLLSLEKTRRYREKIRADPQKYHAWKEKNRLSYLRKKKSINDLSEPMKKQRRKIWREAARRHRARKLEQTAQPTQSQYTVH